MQLLVQCVEHLIQLFGLCGAGARDTDYVSTVGRLTQIADLFLVLVHKEAARVLGVLGARQRQSVLTQNRRQRRDLLVVESTCLGRFFRTGLLGIYTFLELQSVSTCENSLGSDLTANLGSADDLKARQACLVQQHTQFTLNSCTLLDNRLGVVGLGQSFQLTSDSYISGHSLLGARSSYDQDAFLRLAHTIASSTLGDERGGQGNIQIKRNRTRHTRIPSKIGCHSDTRKLHIKHAQA